MCLQELTSTTGSLLHMMFDGITPDPMFLFVEGRKSASASVTFDYLNKWSATAGYNAFWGGVGTTNALSDRDFVSFNLKYSI